MIKRIFIISLCIVALVAALVVPASAAGIDYNDYVTNVRVDGDNDIVTVTMPVSNYPAHFSIFQAGIASPIYTGVTNTVTYTMSYDHRYTIQFIPVYNNYLSTVNIPSDTEVTFDVDITGPGGYNTPSLTVYMRYLIGNTKISESWTHFETAPIPESFPVSVTLDIPTKATQFYPTFQLRNFAPIGINESGTADVTFTIKSYTLVMKISSLYRLQQQTGKTNQLLNEVEKQLEEQGKTLDEVLQQQQQTNDQLGDLNDKQDQTNDKLDDIINGDVDSTPPVGGDSVGDLDDAEGQIRDDAQSGLDQGVDVQQSALQILAQYWSAFACVGWIFSKFTDLPFFSGLLYVSFALGITGAILGLGLSISRSGSQSGYRRARSKGG